MIYIQSIIMTAIGYEYMWWSVYYVTPHNRVSHLLVGSAVDPFGIRWIIIHDSSGDI